LEGLENLISVGEEFRIGTMPAMTSLTGLNNLVSIGNAFSIHKCNSLTNLSGLDRLSSIGHDLQITENDSLINLTGLKNLNSIGRFLYIQDNYKLESLSGQDVSIRIVSVSGNEIYRNENIRVDGKFNKQINLNEAAEGIYSIFVQGDGFVISKKIVIRK